MPKQGILHDYDFMANREPGAQGNVCIVCGSDPASYQWSDYSGEGMCRECGTPYQLKWGSDDQKEEGDYPYLNLNEDWVAVVREYYEETGRFTCLGMMMMGPRPGLQSFDGWVEENHPEMMSED